MADDTAHNTSHEPHQDDQHTLEDPHPAAPVATYIENPLKYNWERSSQVGTITGGGMGAAIGGAVGAAGMFIGAVPGALIGSIVGMVVGIAVGAALDAVAVSFETGV